MMALQGIRILDLSMVWAGPHCTRLLADMGAEIIKIEALRRYDAVRGPKNPPPGSGQYPDGDPGERPYNRAAYFNERNRNKLGITIDMTQPRGVSLFKRLLVISDVVVENFAAGVLDRWGMGYEAMREVKSDIIYCSMPAFGNTGPESHYVGYGVVIEQLAGLGALTGYVNGEPTRTGINFSDPMASMHAAAGILSALYYRAESGKGQFVDVSHRESTISLIGEAVLDWTMNQRVQKPMGNRHTSMAPHGVYPCRGDDMWVSIVVADDAEWQRLRQAMGEPLWAQDERFADVLGRWHNQEEIDQHLAAWTRDKDHYLLADQLQAAGVMAAPVLVNWELLADPQYLDRGWFVRTEHREAGVHDYPGIAWRMNKTPGKVLRAAPCFGEHNREVLGGLLGLVDAELDRLAEEGIIGDVPTAER